MFRVPPLCFDEGSKSTLRMCRWRDVRMKGRNGKKVREFQQRPTPVSSSIFETRSHFQLQQLKLDNDSKYTSSVLVEVMCLSRIFEKLTHFGETSGCMLKLYLLASATHPHLNNERACSSCATFPHFPATFLSSGCKKLFFYENKHL